MDFVVVAARAKGAELAQQHHAWELQEYACSGVGSAKGAPNDYG